MEKANRPARSRLSPEARSLYIDILHGRDTSDVLPHHAIELAGRQYIEPDPLEDDKWTPVDPQEASTSQALRAARTLRVALEELTDLLEPDSELIAEYRAAAGSRTGDIEKVPDPIIAGARIRRLAESCGGEILSAQPIEKPREGHTLAASRSVDTPLLKKGMRVIYPADVRESRSHREQARLMAKAGCVTRTLSCSFPRLFILGELHAVLEDPRGPRPAPGVPRAAVIVHEPSLVAHLRQQFEMMWDASVAFTGREQRPSEELELTARQHQLLRLLVKGLSRKQIADRLELSDSWVDKEISRLRTTVSPGRDVGLVGLGFWYRDYLQRRGMA